MKLDLLPSVTLPSMHITDETIAFISWQLFNMLISNETRASAPRMVTSLVTKTLPDSVRAQHVHRRLPKKDISILLRDHIWVLITGQNYLHKPM